MPRETRIFFLLLLTELLHFIPSINCVLVFYPQQGMWDTVLHEIKYYVFLFIISLS